MRLRLLAFAFALAATQAAATPLDDRKLAMKAMQAQADVQRAASDCRYIRGVDMRADVRAWEASNVDLVSHAKAILAPQGGLTADRAKTLSDLAFRNRGIDTNGADSCLRLQKEVRNGLHDVTERMKVKEISALLQAQPNEPGAHLWMIEHRLKPNGDDVAVSILRDATESLKACDREASQKGHAHVKAAYGSWNDYEPDMDPTLIFAECMLSDVDPVSGLASLGTVASN